MEPCLQAVLVKSQVGGLRLLLQDKACNQNRKIVKVQSRSSYMPFFYCIFSIYGILSLFYGRRIPTEVFFLCRREKIVRKFGLPYTVDPVAVIGVVFW